MPNIRGTPTRSCLTMRSSDVTRRKKEKKEEGWECEWAEEKKNECTSDVSI